jgi:hypothetical protein
VHVGFDGGQLTSDAGILLLAAIEQRLKIAERLAACIEDPRDPDRVLRHVIRRIRARWPKVEIIVRGDSHYGRPEAMAWCERNRVGYIFGLGGNPPRPTRRYTIRIISRIPPMPIPPR